MSSTHTEHRVRQMTERERHCLEQLQLKSEREKEIALECLRDIDEIVETTDLPEREFPIDAYETEFDTALSTHDALLLQAQTGAGKSLSIGVWTLSALEELKGAGNVRVAMTQPRRDAAKGVCLATSARYENLEFGRDICYTTSEFHGNRHDTPLQIQTTQVLVNRFRKDPKLKSYDAVIIDEAHERDMNIDLVMGLIKRANTLRKESGEPPIKVIIASATIDKEKFQSYFDIPQEATLEVEGRLFPVERHYATDDECFYTTPETGEKKEKSFTLLAAQKTVDYLTRTETGDVLVFLPGIRTIRETERYLKDAGLGGPDSPVQVHVLHSSRSQHERNQALSGPKRGIRKVILSTNMAETSVTVPGIKCVIGSGRMNQTHFDADTRLTSLDEVPITKANAIQQEGRAGRVEDGEYHLLLTQEQFEALEDHPLPEVKRLDVTSTLLQMIRLGIKDIENFEFFDRPPQENIDEALHLLLVLGAIDKNRNLTEIGRTMADLPLEPRMARVVAEAQRYKCVIESVAVAQMLSGNNIYKRERNPETEKNREIFQSEANPQSDWLFQWNLFQGYKSAQNREQFCEFYGLEHEQMRYVIDAWRRVISELKKSGVQITSNEDPYGMTQALLSGFAPDHLIKQTANRSGVQFNRLDRDDTSVRINSSSCSYDEKPKLAVCIQLRPGAAKRTRTLRGGKEVEKDWTYAIGVHPITSLELETALPHLVQREVPLHPTMELQDGTVQTTVKFEFQRKDGGWASLPSESLAIKTEQATQYLISHIIFSQDPELQKTFEVKRNRAIDEELKDLHIRSRGSVDWPGLKAWYRGQMGPTISLGEAKDMKTYAPNAYHLERTDYCSDSQKETIEHTAPRKIEIAGVPVAVEYEKDPKSPDEHFFLSVEFIFSYSIKNLDTEYHNIMKLSREHLAEIYAAIPVLTQDDTLVWKENSFSHGFSSLEKLQQEVEKSYLSEKFREQTSPVPVDINVNQYLPTVDSLGFQPILYATTSKGEQKRAYPALSWEPSHWDGGTPTVLLRYYKTPEEAEEKNEKSKEAQIQYFRAQWLKEDRETLIEPAEKIYKELSEKILKWERDTLKGTCLQGFAYKLQTKLKDCRTLHWNDTLKKDPREVIAKMWELMSEIFEFEKIVQHFFDIRKKYKEKQEILEQKLSPQNQSVLGISDETLEKMTQNKTILEKGLGLRYAQYESTDASAQEVLEQIETIFQTLLTWTETIHLPENIELYNKLHEWGNAAVYFYAQDGKHIRAQSVSSGTIGPEIDFTKRHEICIGSFGKCLVVGENGQIYYSSRGDDYFDNSFSLPNGHWIVGRNAEQMMEIRVTDSSIEPIQLVDIEQNPAPGRVFGESIVHPRAADAGGVSEVGVAGESMGTLGDMLFAKQKPEKPKEAPKPVLPEKSGEPEEKEPLSKADKHAFRDQLARILALVDGMSPFMERPAGSSGSGKSKRSKEDKSARGREKEKSAAPVKKKSENSPKGKAMQAMYQKYASCKAEIAHLQEQVENADDVRSFRGMIQSLEGKVQAAYRKNIPKITEDYTENWFETFEQMWNEVDAFVDEDGEVREFVEEGLVNPEALKSAVKAKLSELTEDFQQGAPPNLEEIVAETLEEVME